MEAKPKKERKPRKTKPTLFEIGLTSLRNRRGRPAKYETPEELGEKIAEYIRWEDQKSPTKRGTYTMHGLATFMGFTSRQAIYDSESRGEEFKDVIDLYRMHVIAFNERNLYNMHASKGAMFFLKCWAPDLYKDEVTQNVHTVTSVTPQVVMGDAPKLANDEKDVTV